MDSILNKIKNCHHLQLDSRSVQVNDCFVAIPGGRTDGRDFIQLALEKGASYVLYESNDYALAESLQTDFVLPVHNLRDQLGQLAADFYGQPSQRLKVIGVTGTNGKTSVTHYIAQALSGAGRRCAVMGTLGNGFLDTELSVTGFTTPMVVDVHKELARLWGEGATHVAMEVSSHALDQGRVAGVHFDTVVFTHFSRDHLDYHGSMQNYADAKRRLFTMPGIRQGVFNVDETFGQQLHDVHTTEYTVWGYSLEKDAQAEIRCTAINVLGATTQVQVMTPQGALTFETALLGRFNIGNLCAVLAALLQQGVPLAEVGAHLEKVQPVSGRMMTIRQPAKPYVVVDYAHTPEALSKALLALRLHCRGRLLCVFGCGGDRDRGKRPLMAKAVCEASDHFIITSDNPRSEDPDQIIQDILGGVTAQASYDVIEDREQAIAAAIGHATVDDIVLIAGKGHEQGQIIGDQCFPFCDATVATKYL